MRARTQLLPGRDRSFGEARAVGDSRRGRARAEGPGVRFQFAPPVPYRIGESVYEIVTGRFNSDKAPDFASADNGSDTVSVLLNK